MHADRPSHRTGGQTTGLHSHFPHRPRLHMAPILAPDEVFSTPAVVDSQHRSGRFAPTWWSVPGW